MDPSVYASEALSSMLTSLARLLAEQPQDALTMVATLLFIELDEAMLDKYSSSRYCIGECHRQPTTRLYTTQTATDLLQHVQQVLIARFKRRSKDERRCTAIGCVLECYLVMHAATGVATCGSFMFEHSFLRAMLNPASALVAKQ